MSTIMDHKIEVNPTVTTYIRVLEGVLTHANDIARLEMYHTMERESIFEGIAGWLFEIIQYRHVMWQMGEPVSSEESRIFLAFAFPILRMFAAYFRICGSLVGQVVRRGKSRRFKETTDHFVELRPMSDSLLDALFLMWSSTGGMNGQSFSEECKKIRLAVLDVLTPSLFIEKSLSLVMRHVLVRSCSRTHLFPAVLSLLLTLAPWSPPLILPKTDVVLWKDVVIGHRQRVKRFVNAFISCENRADIAELLLSPNSYVSEMSFAFIERMSSLDYRLTHDLVSILLNYIATSIEGKISVYGKDRTSTPTGSVAGEEVTKKNEVHISHHASSGMVRMMESLQHLCTVNNFRMVMYDFLSRCPNRVRLLSSVLAQFEEPTLESERQLRYQTAVLELLGGLCVPSLWAAEPLSEKNSPLSDFIGLSSLNGSENVEPDDVVFRGQREKISSPAPGSPDNAGKSNGDDKKEETKVHEESHKESQPSNCLEAVLLSLCRFVNNPEQKITLVQHALVMMMDATSKIGQGDAPFVEVMRACMKHIGLLPLFKRLDESFGSDEVMTCLSAVTMILDKIAGDNAEILQKIVRFSPSGHPLSSIISHINDTEQTDERAKFVLQILDKFFQMLNDGSVALEELAKSEPLETPPIYGRVTEVVKIYSKPLVQVVDGTQKVQERTRAASRILVHRKHTLGTRMGSEVAKVIEANKGKEKAVRKILRSRLDIPEDIAVPSPRKRARSSSRT
ncbi:hypothetical protein Y032_0189g1225 [Ancylostoma ceylanicum]|uniref:Uncharacterized protein n=1 Tax=Ancylostoma ceylanicum TaxID=53326 RepID=A0A016SQP4_9BILA|nr:hypothetical protein Y032_0189g1225 [Ancylostoma ceylanicum]